MLERHILAYGLASRVHDSLQLRIDIAAVERHSLLLDRHAARIDALDKQLRIGEPGDLTRRELHLCYAVEVEQIEPVSRLRLRRVVICYVHVDMRQTPSRLIVIDALHDAYLQIARRFQLLGHRVEAPVLLGVEAQGQSVDVDISEYVLLARAHPCERRRHHLQHQIADALHYDLAIGELRRVDAAGNRQVDVDMLLAVGKDEDTHSQRHAELRIDALVLLAHGEVVGIEMIDALQIPVYDDVLAAERKVARLDRERRVVFAVGREVAHVDVVEYRQQILVVEIFERALPAHHGRALLLQTCPEHHGIACGKIEAAARYLDVAQRVPERLVHRIVLEAYASAAQIERAYTQHHIAEDRLRRALRHHRHALGNVIHIAVRTHGALGRGKRHLRIVVEQRIDIGLALGVDRIAHAIILRLNRLEYIAFGGEVELGYIGADAAACEQLAAVGIVEHHIADVGTTAQRRRHRIVYIALGRYPRRDRAAHTPRVDVWRQVFVRIGQIEAVDRTLERIVAAEIVVRQPPLDRCMVVDGHRRIDPRRRIAQHDARRRQTYLRQPPLLVYLAVVICHAPILHGEIQQRYAPRLRLLVALAREVLFDDEGHKIVEVEPGSLLRETYVGSHQTRMLDQDMVVHQLAQGYRHIETAYGDEVRRVVRLVHYHIGGRYPSREYVYIDVAYAYQPSGQLLAVLLDIPLRKRRYAEDHCREQQCHECRNSGSPNYRTSCASPTRRSNISTVGSGLSIHNRR